MSTRRGRGEGAIYRRSRDGRWVGEITLPDTGRRKTITGATRQEAQRKLAALRREIEHGFAPGDPRQTVEQYLSTWLDSIKPTMSDAAWLRHEQFCRLQIVPAIGAVKLAQLSAQHVQSLYAALLASGLSSTTVHHAHATLHKALKAAMRLGLIPRNVTEMVEVPRMQHHEMHVLSPEQARQFIAACEGERHAAALVLALTTGMRQGELLALKWADVDLEHGVLQVRATLQHVKGEGFVFLAPKTKQSRRKIVLPEAAVQGLHKHRIRQQAELVELGPAWEDHDLVFTNRLGRPLDGVHVLRRELHPLLKRAGLPLMRFHDLRHTAATLLLMQGVNPKVVSELLGHHDISITLGIYSHVLPDMQRQAAAAMDEVLEHRGAKQ